MTGAAIPPGVVADAAAAAKGWLRATDGNDAATIAGLCATAIALAEAFCGQALVARDFQETLRASGGWRPLGASPVAAITAVTLADGSALATTAYAIDIDERGTGWVRASLPGGPDRVAVAYRAGAAAGWADLPAPIAQGIAMLVAHLFDDRAASTAPPAAVAALWRPWRRLRLMAEARA